MNERFFPRLDEGWPETLAGDPHRPLDRSRSMNHWRMLDSRAMEILDSRANVEGW